MQECLEAHATQRLAGNVRGRVVIFTRDPRHTGSWLADYFPEIMDVDRPRFPMLYEYEAVLGQVNVVVVPIPDDCTDGFKCAYWRRSKAYLDQRARSAISTFSKCQLADFSIITRIEITLKHGHYFVGTDVRIHNHGLCA